MGHRVTTGWLTALLLSAAPADAQPPASAGPVQIGQFSDGGMRIPPGYPVPYARPSETQVKAVMDRVLTYIAANTQTDLSDAAGRKRAGLSEIGPGDRFQPGFSMTSYEWGVTYAGALLAGTVTGDQRYTRYAADRINLVSDLAARYRALGTPPTDTPVRGLLAPNKLDDSGAMAAALIKLQRAGLADPNVRAQIDVSVDWVANKQFRLADGTLAREVPMPRTLWLDDLFMSVPALAQMGALTGDRRFFDDAVRQVLQFSQRMFVPEQGLYMHGWVEGMMPHPAFFWGRANGWAVMAMVELLDVLPADHPGRSAVLAQLRAHVAGLARTQGGTGLWHQLLDRSDSYLETSATAIFAYSIARAVNRGWIDRRAYAPVATLAWNAVTTKVSAAGEVEDVCVGTGMQFDPIFYYYRPRSIRAAHGYGPVLLAGAEMIALLRGAAARGDSGGSGLLFQ